MNRVASRAFIVLVLVLGLLGGTAFFVAEYAMKADQWVMSAGSVHVDEDDGVRLGYVTDRNDQVLVELGEERAYSADLLVRRATLHWVGDRSGNIPGNIISYYTKELLDYSKITGTYHYGDVNGQLKLTLDANVQAAAQQAMGD